jgi:hypothetical protein
MSALERAQVALGRTLAFVSIAADRVRARSAGGQAERLQSDVREPLPQRRVGSRIEGEDRYLDAVVAGLLEHLEQAPGSSRR